MYAIQVEDLVKRYGKTTALDGLSLEVPTGCVQGLLGSNGAGKTTMIRILATLLRPDGGVARVGGFDVTKNAAEVRATIGLTGQFAAVDDDLTGYENLLLIGRLLKLSRPQAKRRASMLLERFGLADVGKQLAKTYSGGMRRRLDLALVMVGEPAVLFLDEPTTGLDPRSRAELWDMVRDLVAGGATVLLTTQQLDEADRLASQIAVIDHGKLIASGTPAELKSRAGGQSLDVRPADRADLEHTRSVVTAAVGEAEVRAAEGVVSVPLVPALSGPDALAAVARRLDDAGIEVAEIGIRLATLDEVFLSLTGRPTVTEAPAEAAPADAAQVTGEPR
ncbi:daunorubicin resistance protein DrrA family ABC transporter ATP-binding protein [Dactylosporangium sucinum]|uniref:Daunorubicin resistance protein DrrA family ABC transporter ATP-binding protein n=1 Tax=Dactylosporangium sucinum TaxID=1424081 RepID=A0A917UAI8_9ACTN|nr:daunorubicin resistance protein DrrA family ABC transporter ATP-binding protein [Dactylosporangium sucinum]